MEEEWRDIEDYEGLYKVSNFGSVYSYYTNKILKQGTLQDGYKFVILYKNKRKNIGIVHRLVAKAFIPNYDDMPLINHKDEDKTNNHVDNLEWCDYEYNNTYNDIHKKRESATAKKVYGYNKDCELVYKYKSVTAAANTLGFSSGSMCACCNGKLYTYKGIVWSYIELSKEEIENKFLLSNAYRCNTKNNFLSKRVNQYDLDGNFMQSYPSVEEAARQLNFSSSNISSVCRGEHKQTHGYIFKYADNINGGIV